MTTQKLEPTNSEIFNEVKQLHMKIDMLVQAAEKGGGLVPHVDYVVMQKRRKILTRRGIKIHKCPKVCIVGPCRYGAQQALECFEEFEQKMKKLKFRKLLSEGIPYTNKQLSELRRRDMMVIASVLGINLRNVWRRSKGGGNAPLIEAIVKAQPRYVKMREKLEKLKQKQKVVINEALVQ